MYFEKLGYDNFSQKNSGENEFFSHPNNNKSNSDEFSITKGICFP